MRIIKNTVTRREFEQLEIINEELKKENEELKEQNEMLTECILEMAEIVYA